MSEQQTSKTEPERALADESEGESLLELVLAAHQAEVAAPARIEGIVVARLGGIGPGGEPLIDLPWWREAVAAKAMISLAEADVGVELAVLFEGGDPRRPVVMGRMHVPAPVGAREAPIESESESESKSESAPAAEAEATSDGERLVFSAEKEIVLRCGESSITLTRAGKVLIRGAYVLTRSSGVNRIQGGSVQIN